MPCVWVLPLCGDSRSGRPRNPHHDLPLTCLLHGLTPMRMRRSLCCSWRVRVLATWGEGRGGGGVKEGGESEDGEAQHAWVVEGQRDGVEGGVKG